MERDTLVLTFKTTEGKLTNLSVNEVKSNLSESVISQCMDDIITSNIFLTSSGYLVEKVKAQIVKRTTVLEKEFVA